MRILHGEISDVFPPMRTSGNFGFINAAVRLSGRSWSVECELREFPDLKGLDPIESWVHAGIDAIWVVGRLKAIFGNWIELNEGEKSILNEGFVAHCKAENISVPFVLHDHYLRTSFMFGATLGDQKLKCEIARSFYRLLLADPDDLVDFEFRKDHVGAGFTMVGGIAGGQVQYDEER